MHSRETFTHAQCRVSSFWDVIQTVSYDNMKSIVSMKLNSWILTGFWGFFSLQQFENYLKMICYTLKSYQADSLECNKYLLPFLITSISMRCGSGSSIFTRVELNVAIINSNNNRNGTNILVSVCLDWETLHLDFIRAKFSIAIVVFII